jgi:hypothetical protein
VDEKVSCVLFGQDGPALSFPLLLPCLHLETSFVLTRLLLFFTLLTWLFFGILLGRRNGR